MSATSMGSPVSRRLRLKARKLPDKSSYPVTEPFDPGSLSVAISSYGTLSPLTAVQHTCRLPEDERTCRTQWNLLAVGSEQCVKDGGFKPCSPQLFSEPDCIPDSLGFSGRCCRPA